MDFIKRHKKFFILTSSFLCIITIIITVLYREKPTMIENALGFIITPMQKVSTGVSKYVGDKINFYANINKIENDNITLKKQVEELTEENKRLSFLEEDIEKLTKLFEIDQMHPNYSKIGAYVISRDPSNWNDTFMIDKGTNHGLSKNMTVLAKGGLVGKIIESGFNYSKVLLLIDDTSTVSAMILRTGDSGLVRGDMSLTFDGLCIMENIDINAPIVENDEVITSHLSKIYPPGITIGHVREIKTDAKGLSKYAIIEPVVDFKYLDTVLVINELFVKDVEGFINMEEN